MYHFSTHHTPPFSHIITQIFIIKLLLKNRLNNISFKNASTVVSSSSRFISLSMPLISISIKLIPIELQVFLHTPLLASKIPKEILYHIHTLYFTRPNKQGFQLILSSNLSSRRKKITCICTAL